MARQSPVFGALLALGLLASIVALGYIDYASGHELNFFVFYFIPISWAAYRLGLLPAVGCAVACAIIWAVADRLAEHVYSSPAIAVWNTLIRLTAFIAIGAAVARIRALLHQQAEITRQLQQTAAELKVLQGLLSICASCKQIKEADGSWHQLEVYIAQHSEAHFTHGLCPACAQRFLDDAGLTGTLPEMAR